MTEKPRGFHRFFLELKRRHVFRVLAMYAGAAFVIIELTNNVVDPLRLPQWLPTVIILLLIVGFPITAILSWIFDLTPKGIERTEPIEVQPADKEIDKNVRRRLRASDIIIAMLLIAVGILVYPKLFNKDDLRKSRDGDGKITLAILRFENLTGDTLYNVWQSGVQDLLITGLSDSDELIVRQYQSTNSLMSQNDLNYAALTPGLIRDVGAKLDLQTVVKGTIMQAGNNLRMDAQILDTETGDIHKSFRVHGSSEDDFFAMVDSLSWQIKNYAEIKSMQEQRDSPLFQSASLGYTRSSEAFKYYIHGIDANNEFDMGQSALWMSRAVEVDSTFTAARIMLAYSLHNNNQDAKAREVVVRAYEMKDHLPLADKLHLEHLNAYFFKTPLEEQLYAKQLVELDEMNPANWHLLAVSHYKVNEFKEAIDAWERLFGIVEKWGSEWVNPFAYFLMADALYKLQEFEKEEELLQQGLRLFPTNGYLQTYRLILALAQEDTVRINQVMEEYLDFRHNVTNCPEALISNDLGYIYVQAGQVEEAERQYRLAIEQNPGSIQFHFNLAKFLIDEEVNVDEGLDIVERVLERFPNQWAATSYKGWALFKKGELDEALKLLRKGWENKPIYNHLYYMHLEEAEQAAEENNMI
jgi:tetratricopeptide (TPR) repeat protein/TolB-like protein